MCQIFVKIIKINKITIKTKLKYHKISNLETPRPPFFRPNNHHHPPRQRQQTSNRPGHGS